MPEFDFIGRGWGFPPTFNRGLCGVEMLTGKDDVQSSIEILLSTGVGERVMLPDYGADMQRLLFEPLNTTLVNFMQETLRRAILFHEPRVILNQVLIEPVSLEGLVNIKIDYTMRGTNTRHNFVFPFYIEEGTEIA